MIRASTATNRAENSLCGSGFAAFVGDVDTEAVAVGDAALGPRSSASGTNRIENLPSSSSEVSPAATTWLCADAEGYHQYHHRG